MGMFYHHEIEPFYVEGFVACGDIFCTKFTANWAKKNNGLHELIDDLRNFTCLINYYLITLGT